MIATVRYIRLHVIPMIVWIIYLSQSNAFMIWYDDHEVTITRCQSLSFRPPWTHLLIILCLLLYKWHNVLVYIVKFQCYVNRIGECGWAFVSVNKRCTYLYNQQLLSKLSRKRIKRWLLIWRIVSELTDSLLSRLDWNYSAKHHLLL